MQHIKLIAECSAERYVVAELKLSRVERGVGMVSDMAAHSSCGIAERRGILNIDAVLGVGIVARPYLMREAHHSEVIASAASAAVLKHCVREVLAQP